MDEARTAVVKWEFWQRAMLLAMFANANKPKDAEPREPWQFDPYGKKPEPVPVRKISASRLADIMLGPEKPTT